VFEEATWKLDNRRFFAVFEHLHGQAGVPLREEPLGLSLVSTEGLSRLLRVSIEEFSADTMGKKKNRVQRRIYKALTPDGGARAAVMLTVALGEMLAREGADVHFQQQAVAEYFDVPPVDEEIVEAISANGLDPHYAAVGGLCALEMATSHELVGTLPFFEKLRPDWRSLLAAQPGKLNWYLLASVMMPAVLTNATEGYTNAALA
jgi:hypothetical protein